MEQKNNLTCLNCGRTSSGVYCPDCGQLLQTTKRITMKTFWKGVVMSFASLTPGFWSTFVGLLLHPWQVIRQYINGQRVKYSPPVTMVMQLLLYSTFIYTILGNIFHVDFFASSSEETISTGNWFVNMLVSSDVITKIFIAYVPAFNCYIAYGLTTGRKYNLAEYLTAAIYMGCSFSIYNNLLKPFAIFYPDTERFIRISIITIIGTISLSKAFPVKQWWRRCLIWIGFMSLNIITLLIAVLIMLIVQLL